MNKALIVLTLSFFSACTGLFPIIPAGNHERESIMQQCLVPFVKGPHRFVHAISGTLPGGVTATMVGVSVIYPNSGKLSCTLMSLEGLVILDAEYDRKLVIKRGIGPFSSEDMVMGMIRDIRLVLYKPSGTMLDCGRTKKGSMICRYGGGSENVDIIMAEHGEFTIRSYNDKKLMRTVKFSSLRRDGVPVSITLVATGPFRYSLQLDCIESEQVR